MFITSRFFVIGGILNIVVDYFVCISERIETRVFDFKLQKYIKKSIYNLFYIIRFNFFATFAVEKLK